MLLDINGNPKEIPKKKNKKKLSAEQFAETVQKLLRSNLEEYCLFYIRDGVFYKLTNRLDDDIDDFIKEHERDKLENLIYDCIDRHFCEEACEEDCYDAISIEEEQAFINRIIEELAKRNSKKD